MSTYFDDYKGEEKQHKPFDKDRHEDNDSSSSNPSTSFFKIIILFLIAVVGLRLMTTTFSAVMMVGVFSSIAWGPGLLAGFLVSKLLQKFVFRSLLEKPETSLAQVINIRFEKNKLVGVAYDSELTRLARKISFPAAFVGLFVTAGIFIYLISQTSIFIVSTLSSSFYSEAVEIISSDYTLRFYSFVFSACVLVISFFLARPSKFFKKAIDEKFDKINLKIKDMDRLQADIKRVASLATTCHVAFPLNYLTSIRQHIESHPAEIVANADELNKAIQFEILAAEDDYQHLSQADEALRNAKNLYSDLPDNLPEHIREEAELFSDILGSGTFYALLAEKRWEEFSEIISFMTAQLHACSTQNFSKTSAHEPEPLQQLISAIAHELEQEKNYQGAARMARKVDDRLKAIELYARAGKANEEHSLLKDAVRMYENALACFQEYHEESPQTVESQRSWYLDYIDTHPGDHLARFAFADFSLQHQDWDRALTLFQQVLDESSSDVLQGKALLARAQCFLGRAEGADIMLGFQDIERALTQYQKIFSVEELIEMASQLRDANYLQVTGTQIRFPQEYQQALTLLLNAVEQHYTELITSHQISTTEVIAQSEQLQEQFPELAEVILTSMVTVRRQELRESSDIDHSSIFDLAFTLRKRNASHLADALVQELVQVYAVQFSQNDSVDVEEFLDAAKQLQQYDFPEQAEELIFKMTTWYQNQLRQKTTINVTSILSVGSKIESLGFTEPARQLLKQTVELLREDWKKSTNHPQTLTQSSQDEDMALFTFAVQLWQYHEHDLAGEVLDTIGTRYQQRIEHSHACVPQVMAIASEYWQKAQEEPDIPLYDRLVEQLWQAIVSALETSLAPEKLSKTNVEEYYWLFKAYQAIREPVKCTNIGLKILGVIGVQGYKDVRQIVDNIVTGGFQHTQWEPTGDDLPTGDSMIISPAPSIAKTEVFGDYTGTFYTKGGMGEIYKGTGPNGETVAIKRIPRYSLHGNRLERFAREIQVVRELSHPYIVNVLAVNQDEGYYVMEWAEQGTLEDRLKNVNTLPFERALDVTRQIADALEAVHQREIVHRDIKPSNILLFADGTAKLTDFGVAHAERAETLTGTGVQVGTLRYMSPEQYLAEDIDAKTDIFALGLVLFEMLTGDIPFANPRELCQRDIEEILTERPSAIPAVVQPVIIKCLRNNANRRYTAQELKHAIYDLQDGV